MPSAETFVRWHTVITASAWGNAYFIAEYQRHSSSSSAGENSYPALLPVSRGFPPEARTLFPGKGTMFVMGWALLRVTRSASVFIVKGEYLYLMLHLIGESRRCILKQRPL